MFSQFREARRFVRGVAIAACLISLILPATAFAGGADHLVVDPLNGFSLVAPEGWRASTPDPDALVGSTVLTSYDPDRMARSPHGQEKVFGPDQIKISLMHAERAVGESFADWAAERVAALQASARVPDYESGLSTVGEAKTARVAGRSASLFTVTGETLTPMLQIDIDWGPGVVLSARVTPATSAALGQALSVLESLSASLEAAPVVVTSKRAAAPVSGALAAASELASEIQFTQEVVAKAIASCPPGTFSGGEAAYGGNEINLRLPFQYQSGYYWEAGEFGSYYGNGAHCNGNNDYYAVDWNRYSDSNCNTDAGDDGQPVLAMAGGTVTRKVTEANDTTGYGNHIEITHTVGANRYRTRYAHLKTMAVNLNDPVSQGQQIGTVGNTGNSAGAHLHQSFQKDVNGTFYSHCYNGGSTCANGDAPAWPQSPRPSPLQTASGSTYISDGGCYQGVSGGGTGTTVTVDDSDPGASLLGNAAWWYPVFGYGQNGQMHYTWNNQSGVDNYVYWDLAIPTSGTYTFQVYIPSNHATATSAKYAVYDGSTWHWYTVNQNIYYNQWVTLGSHYVTVGTRHVYLQDATGEATGTRKVGVDAVRAVR